MKKNLLSQKKGKLLIGGLVLLIILILILIIYNSSSNTSDKKLLINCKKETTILNNVTLKFENKFYKSKHENEFVQEITFINTNEGNKVTYHEICDSLKASIEGKISDTFGKTSKYIKYTGDSDDNSMSFKISYIINSENEEEMNSYFGMEMLDFDLNEIIDSFSGGGFNCEQY